jgi:uncharacterized protein (TIGR03084 family)
MLTQAADFAAESDALADLLAGCSAADLGAETLFKRWTIADVIGHLHVWNYAADLSLRSRDEFSAFACQIAAHGGGLNVFEKSWLGDLGGAALVSAWAAYYPGMAARFADADPSARVVWVGPDMSVRSAITARLMETWAHAQAVYDLLGVTRVNTDRIGNIVVLGVNTFGWTYRNRGRVVPEKMPHLVLAAPSGTLWTYGDESNAERITGPAEAFCQVVTQTRNIADVPLQVTGPVAAEWMAMAQCFAGAPASPPPPGTRRPRAVA